MEPPHLHHEDLRHRFLERLHALPNTNDTAPQHILRAAVHTQENLRTLRSHSSREVNTKAFASPLTAADRRKRYPEYWNSSGFHSRLIPARRDNSFPPALHLATIILHIWKWRLDGTWMVLWLPISCMRSPKVYAAPPMLKPLSWCSRGEGRSSQDGWSHTVWRRPVLVLCHLTPMFPKNNKL